MLVKEMIEKLSTLPPDMRVKWHDAIEGNDCLVDGLIFFENEVDVSPQCYKTKYTGNGQEHSYETTDEPIFGKVL